ncbi:MAG: hypothetical protein AB7W59_16925, partial [Acidimicrobiia bacterium]
TAAPSSSAIFEQAPVAVLNSAAASNAAVPRPSRPAALRDRSARLDGTALVKLTGGENTTTPARPPGAGRL